MNLILLDLDFTTFKFGLKYQRLLLQRLPFKLTLTLVLFQNSFQIYHKIFKDVHYLSQLKELPVLSLTLSLKAVLSARLAIFCKMVLALRIRLAKQGNISTSATVFPLIQTAETSILLLVYASIVTTVLAIISTMELASAKT